VPIAPRVHISLTPTMLEVAVISSMGVSASAGAPLDPDQWDSSWQNWLTPLDDTLRELLNRVGARGRFRTRVFYTSPDAFAEVHTVPGTGDTALHAAELALRDRVPFDADENPLSVCPIARDGAGHGRSHALLVADTDEHCESVVSWVERCGGKVIQLAPISALVLNALVREACSDRDEAPRVRAFVGEHEFTLVGSEGGHVLFVRTASIGYGLLGEAFCRGATTQTAREIDRTEAMIALFDCGLPESPSEVIPLGSGVGGSSILPHIQPVLQRFYVELRQTLRFGFGETNLQRVRVELKGPGALIPSFITNLGEQLGIEITGLPATERFDPTMACGTHGTLHLATCVSPTEVSLIPTAVLDRRRRSRLGASLRLGAAAALVIVAGDTAYTWKQTTDIRAAMDDNHARIAHVELEQARWEEAVGLSTELVATKQALVDALGERADWFAVLQEIGRQTTYPVRLTEIQARIDQGDVVITIKGFAFDTDGRSGSDVLGGYIDRLTQSPVTSLVSIGSTQRAEIDAKPGVKFALDAAVVCVPLAAADLEATP